MFLNTISSKLRSIPASCFLYLEHSPLKMGIFYLRQLGLAQVILLKILS